MEVKIGEAQGKRAIKNFSKTDELKVFLRVVWKKKSEEVAFNPAEDIKMGDEIKITVMKVSGSAGEDGK